MVREGLPRWRDRHARARARVAADRRVDHAARGRIALHDREVDAAHAAVGELLHQARLRVDRLRHHEQPARVLVEAMDDAGARHAGKRRRVREQRVEQRAVGLAGARMHHQSGRLVDHDQRGVLVHDLERHALRLRHVRRRRRGLEHDPLASRDRVLCFQGNTVFQANVARLQPDLQAIARVLREQADQRLVQSQPAELGGHGRAHRRREAGVPVNVIIFPLHASQFTFHRAVRRRPARRRLQHPVELARRRDHRLVGAAPVWRGEGRHGGQGLAQGDQVPREARGALSLRPLRPAGAARDRLLQLEGR